MTERIEHIRSMLESSPDDVFLHYSLAMEYVAAKRCDEAASQFDACINLDADYLPAYVEAGKSLRSAGRLDQARQTFAAGLELAVRQGNHHIRDFIQQQLDGLQPEK